MKSATLPTTLPTINTSKTYSIHLADKVMAIDAIAIFKGMFFILGMLVMVKLMHG